MKNYRFVFYTSDKPRTKVWGEMLAQGARVHGDTVEFLHQCEYKEPLQDFDGGGKLGMSIACKRLMNAHIEAGKHFLYFDKGYVGRNLYWRVSVDAWQPLAYFQRFMRPDDRMLAAKITYKERGKTYYARPIVFAGACQNYNNFFDLGDINDYNLDVLKNLRANSDRIIIYRPNPSWYAQHGAEFRDIYSDIPDVMLSEPSTPFTEAINDCHLLVTHGSSASFVALQRGIPTMVLGGGICRPMGLTDGEWDQIDSPRWLKEGKRRQFFSDLAYCQWTTDEFRSGKAWGELRLVFSSLEAEKSEITLNDVIKQYQLMHKHPNYFRGLTTLKYVEEITTLVRFTNATKLLDYGCGKGAQYEAPYNLQHLWRANVALYDPGIKIISKYPNGQFEGVICCDVMEHVPEFAVPDVLRDIMKLATKFVFFAIATSPATKQLPDGRNCHLTIQSEQWWTKRIYQALEEAGADRNKLIVKIVAAEDYDE